MKKLPKLTLFKKEKKEKKIEKCGIDLNEDSYRNITKLGEGNFGAVYLIYHEGIKKKLALKIIIADNSEEENMERMVQELHIHYNCKSPHIVKCYGYMMKGNELYIAMEFMNFGPLSRITKYKKNLHENFLGYVACQVIRALKYLHNSKILHRDIKPSNILINYEGEVKIADFGESGKLKETISYKNTLVGTLLYNSPERVTGNKYYPNCDIWSLGLLIFECALGRFPLFPENGKPVNLTFIGFEEMLHKKKLPKLPDNYSSKFKDFVSQCLIKDPSRRPYAEDLMNHPFIKKFSKVKSKDFGNILKVISKQLKILRIN